MSPPREVIGFQIRPRLPVLQAYERKELVLAALLTLAQYALVAGRFGEHA